jgi:hypothetical protein
MEKFIYLRSNKNTKGVCMKRKIVFLTLLFSFILFSNFVFGATSYNILDQVLSPFGGFTIPEIYERYSSVFDFVIYMLLFMGLLKATLSKVEAFKDPKASMVINVLAIAFAISLSWWGSVSNFSLRSLGPLVSIIFLAFIGFAMYNILKGSGQADDKALGIAGAFLIVYFGMIAIAPTTWLWINEKTPSVGAILTILSVIAIIIVIIKITAKIKGLMSKGSSGAGAGSDSILREGQRGRGRLTTDMGNLGKQIGDNDELKNQKTIESIEAEYITDAKLKEIGNSLNRVINAYNDGFKADEINKGLEDIKVYLNTDIK